MFTGGRYDPDTDTWASTRTDGAPQARSRHTAIWTGTEMIIWGGRQGANTLPSGARYNPIANQWTATSNTGAPSARDLHSAVWTGNRMVIWGGTGTQTHGNGARYNPANNTWTATSNAGAAEARYEHTAVWTGTEMIVWGGNGLGGRLGTGGRYNPVANTWQPTRSSQAPSARDYHTAIWTGAELIVWGGNTDADASGGRYRPATDSWSPTNGQDAPSARQSHTAVWTGSEMIIWGGWRQSFNVHFDTGARYNPLADNWTATSNASPPAERRHHSAVWTGSEMIVWGGRDSASRLATGGRYDPASNTWTATPTLGAPTARDEHTAVWTDEAMIVWGGSNGASTFSTGARFVPSSNNWTAINPTGAPSARRQHTALWTGAEMIVWGGCASTGTFEGCSSAADLLSSGSRYDPSDDGWSATSGLDAPAKRDRHSAVWTGSEMIVWGGNNAIYDFGVISALRDGSRYSPTANNWLATDTGSAPLARYGHVAAWTGDEMLVFGGYSLGDLAAYYPYGLATESTATTINATLPNPSAAGEPISISVSVSGSTAAPLAGAVTVLASTGESCTAPTPDASSGLIATYACGIILPAPGNINLVATYEGFRQFAGSVSAAAMHEVVVSPTLSIDDVSAFEGDSGITDFVFTITRSHALTALSVRVDTLNGTTDGGDFHGYFEHTISMPAGGALSAEVVVEVFGDTVLEADELFSVVLSNPIGATIAHGQGTGTILNDDAASVSISNVSQAEGNSGFSTFAFEVTLSGNVETHFTLPYETADGTATAPSDYLSASGSLTFGGGDGEKQIIEIVVVGDEEVEPDETFTVTLGPPSYAAVTVSPSVGIGTIINDDQLNATLTALAVPSPASPGQQVTVSANLELPAGAPQPSGTITVTGPAGDGCTISLPATMCSFTPTYFGTQTLDVSYPGNLQIAAAATSVNHGVFRIADLSVSKDDGRSVVRVGDVLVYQIIVRNDGPDSAPGVLLVDTIPSNLTAASWTCTGSACPTSAGGGSIGQTLTLQAGQQVDYALSATVATGALPFVENTASIAPSSAAPHFVFDPDTDDQVAVDINLVDDIFSDGYEGP